MVQVEPAAASPGLGRAFRMLWAATAAANLGDGLALLLLPLVALQLGGSPSAVAGVTVALTLAWPLFGLHAGLIVDRLDRRRLLASINVARALTIAAVGVLWQGGWLTLPVLYAAAAILGASETLVDTGLTSLVPQVVARSHLTRANSRIEATTNVANQFIGPPLGGLLAGVGLTLAACTAAGTYGLAVLALTAMPGPPAPGTRVGRPRLREVGAGLALLWRHPLLRTLTLLTAGMNVFWAAWMPLLVVQAVAPGPMGLSEPQYGLLLTAMAVGGTLGAVLVEPARRWLGTKAVLTLDLVGTAVMVAAPGITHRAWMVGAAIFVGGAGASVWRVINAALRQALVGDELLGRVYAASRTISWGVLPVGAALGGVTAELVGIGPVLVTSGILSTGLLVAFRAGVRGQDLDRILEVGPPAG